MRAWPYQEGRRKGSPWYVGWREPDGTRRCKSCGPGRAGEKLARREAERIHAALVSGSYAEPGNRTWREFRAEYERSLAAAGKETRRMARGALAAFERLCRPSLVSKLTARDIDRFAALRSAEPGKRKGDVLSPASVNKDLGYLRTALRAAHDWGYLDKVPRFKFVREPARIPRYVTPEHFALLWAACGSADAPLGVGCPPADWWRGLLAFAYLTGWRVGEILSLDRADVDLAAGWALTLAEDNKGRRDERVPLHPALVAQLQRVDCPGRRWFPWPHSTKALYAAFHRLHRAAGISLPCRKQHEHSRFCHAYGFHDLRRAFATQNALRLPAEALQRLMRHKSYQTTKLYISLAEQIHAAAENLYVPPCLGG